MSKLGVDIGTEAPDTFTRGQDLEFVMELPCDVPKDYFHSSVVGPPAVAVDTTLEAELRQVQNAGPDGFIAALNVAWEPNTNYTKVRIKATTTEGWPLGPAEFDVVFVRSVTTTPPGSTATKKFRSKKVSFTIEDGVTA